MQVCFVGDGVALVMPVTPASYRWTSGKRMETVHISRLGDVYLPGGRARFSGKLEFLLPARDYPWMEAGAVADPEYYLRYLDAWAREEKPVRLVITGTEINTLVYIEEVEREERDGTGDRYVTVSLREHCPLAAAETEGPAQNSPRPDTESGGTGNTGAVQRYTVVSGDTLSAICRRYYGKSTAAYYNALARYNGIKNPHLIFPGQVLRIPPEAVLLEVGT